MWLWAGCNKTSATLVCFQKYFKRSYMTNLFSRGRSWKGNGCRAWTRSDYCAPAGTQPHNIRHWILTFLGFTYPLIMPFSPCPVPSSHGFFCSALFSKMILASGSALCEGSLSSPTLSYSSSSNSNSRYSSSSSYSSSSTSTR